MRLFLRPSDTLSAMWILHNLLWIRVFRAAVLVALTLHAPSGAAAQATAGGNAADAWRRVFPLIRERDERTNPEGILTTGEWEQLWDGILGSEMDAGRDERTRALMAKLQPAFELMDQATAQRRCNFNLDRSEGFDLVLPHLTNMRRVNHLMTAKADLQLADGDIEGLVRTHGQLVTMSLQPGQDELLVCSLVGTAMAAEGTLQMRQAIDEGSLTQEAAKKLLEEISPLRGQDPFGLAAAVEGEHASIEAELKRAIAKGMNGRGFMERIGMIVPHDGPAPDPSALLQALPGLKPALDLRARALLETDPDRRDRLIRKADAIMDSLQGDAAVLRMLMPALDRVGESMDRHRADIESLAALLKRLADEPDAAAKMRSPALLWARIAARVNAIPDDRQDGIELVRASGPRHDDSVVEAGMSCLEGCRETILSDMAVAAAIERKDLDFAKVRGVRGTPPFRTLGGMRGAARVALADAWLVDVDQAIERIGLAAAAVQALAADPHQPSSCMALACARDLIPDVRRVARLPGMNAERRQRLEQAVARIDRRDPFGFKASLEAERAWISKSLSGRCEPREPDEFRKALRRRPAGWIMSAAIEYHDHIPEPAEDAPPLVDLADVFPLDQVKAVREAAGRFVLAVNQPEAGANRTHPALGSLPVPVLRDVAQDTTEAQAVLSQLDAAVRGE